MCVCAFVSVFIVFLRGPEHVCVCGCVFISVCLWPCLCVYTCVPVGLRVGRYVRLCAEFVHRFSPALTFPIVSR